MTLGTNNMQTAGSQNRVVANLPGSFDFCNFLIGGFFTQVFNFNLPAAAQHDIGTTTGHVGSDGHCAWLACLRDDIRFFSVEFGVQNAVRNACFGQFVRNNF
ncbi:hypothetical protein SRABI106_02397 [Rahnella aquatilis]|nr:hypothetical protein SRABI106_02397 [Rahnella aquatilis]